MAIPKCKKCKKSDRIILKNGHPYCKRCKTKVLAKSDFKSFLNEKKYEYKGEEKNLFDFKTFKFKGKTIDIPRFIEKMSGGDWSSYHKIYMQHLNGITWRNPVDLVQIYMTNDWFNKFDSIKKLEDNYEFVGALVLYVLANVMAEEGNVDDVNILEKITMKRLKNYRNLLPQEEVNIHKYVFNKVEEFIT
jgi:hypothetical protein